ncbi:MAG: substrate-binding domain-containing protein [Desulfatitalea sp.]|nr:substrate-binding domain-containing protein [Desulfatitalea sp.]NNJ98853.1 substrate-binding domain-containing protein [Desulfatitalea sp.]
MMPPCQRALSRRAFLTGSAALTANAILPATAPAATQDAYGVLQVWSCGGLAEAFMPANARFKEITGIEIAYTGAFAAALGKSLMGNAVTEVFAGRVLDLARKLRAAEKMIYFEPLCFSRYVLVTPKGNPAGISDIQDLAKPGIRVILAPKASPPGGQAVIGLLKKAGVATKALQNAVVQGSCVQRTMKQLIDGQGDVSVVEYRLTRMPLFVDKVEVISIPTQYFPSPPLTFTIGVMQAARDRSLADRYVAYILSPEGQAIFENAGFIPASSEQGRQLVEKLGVKDA